MFNEKTNAIAVKINNTYKPDMTDFQLYDTCRTAWDIDKEKRSILKYVDAGTTLNTINTEDKIVSAETRSEFVGKFAEDEIRDKYKGTQLTDYAEKSYGNFVYMNVNKN